MEAPMIKALRKCRVLRISVSSQTAGLSGLARSVPVRRAMVLAEAGGAQSQRGPSTSPHYGLVNYALYMIVDQV